MSACISLVGQSLQPQSQCDSSPRPVPSRARRRQSPSASGSRESSVLGYATRILPRGREAGSVGSREERERSAGHNGDFRRRRRAELDPSYVWHRASRYLREVDSFAGEGVGASFVDQSQPLEHCQLAPERRRTATDRRPIRLRNLESET
jgi:hypothetical protein